MKNLTVNHSRKYSPEIIDFIKKHYERAKTYNELCNMINIHFGTAFTHSQILHAAYNSGIRKGNVICNPKPLYTEHINCKGHVMIKISMTGPKMWQEKHRWIWEQANGVIPKGMVIIFLDGNNRNYALENLAIVSRTEAVKLSQFRLRSDNKEKTLVGIALVKYISAIHERLKENLGSKDYKRFADETSEKKIRWLERYKNKENTEPKVQTRIVPYHFTLEQIEWLKKNALGQTYKSLTEAFNSNFGMVFTERKIKKCLWRHAIRTGVRPPRTGGRNDGRRKNNNG
jgi:hypothetical protein